MSHIIHNVTRIIRKLSFPSCFVIFVSISLVFGDAVALGYDPLQVTGNVQTLDLTIDDTERKRNIPLRIYLPNTNSPAPVIMFSHGLGGARTNNAYLGNHWAGRGYVAVFMQHPGSDEELWKERSKLRGFLAMKRAAGYENFMLRVQDVPKIIDALGEWNSGASSPLYNKMDLNKLGMSGHSFGAVTAQAVSGQKFKYSKAGFTDKRIKAAVMFSPNIPKSGESAQKAFGMVTIPWLLMTGTLDDSPIGNGDANSRRKVFPALPNGDKYELVLYKAEHSAFGDRALPNEKEPRNPNHHKAILAISTAFFDAYLKNDQLAHRWLSNDEVRSVLETSDAWQAK